MQQNEEKRQHRDVDGYYMEKMNKEDDAVVEKQVWKMEDKKVGRRLVV